MSTNNVIRAFRFKAMNISWWFVGMSNATHCVQSWLSERKIGSGVHCGDGFESLNPILRGYRPGLRLDFPVGRSVSASAFQKRNWRQFDCPPNEASRWVTKAGLNLLPVVSTWKRPCAQAAGNVFASQNKRTKRPDPSFEFGYCGRSARSEATSRIIAKKAHNVVAAR